MIVGCVSIITIRDSDGAHVTTEENMIDVDSYVKTHKNDTLRTHTLDSNLDK